MDPHELADFVSRWSLKAEAQQILYSSDPATQQKIITEFNPRDTTRDANAIFCKFAKGACSPIGTCRGVRDHSLLDSKTSQFLSQWTLDETAQLTLMSLDPQVKLRVLDDFNPRDTSRDVSGIFMKFAQGVANGTPRTSGKGRNGGTYFGKGYGKGMPFRYQASNWPKSVGDPATSQAVRDFVSRWDLHAASVQLLSSLSPAEQTKVMMDFSPRDTSRDVNAVFMKFARGVAHGRSSNNVLPQDPSKQSATTFDAQVASEENGLFDMTQATGETSAQAVEGSGRSGSLEEFIQRWQLGEAAQALLFELTQEQQEKVISEFLPRDTSSDVNNIFIRFAQGIQRGVPRTRPLRTNPY